MNLNKNKISYTFRILKAIDNSINFVLTALLKLCRYLYLSTEKVFKRFEYKWYNLNEKMRPFLTNGYKYEQYCREKENHAKYEKEKATSL